MKLYFGYVRVSTKKQGAGASLPQQKTAITEYAAKHNLTVTEWFVEKETAAKQGRTQFTKMMASLGEGRAQGVIIHKIDRSARNLKDWVQLGELFDKGVDVQFAHEALDLTTRSGRLTGDLLAVIAADFIRNNRDEVLKGFYGRLNQGLYPLAAPLGYLDQGRGKPKVHDPRTGPLVRQMFDLYATGRYSLWTIRAEMKRRGLRNRAGMVLSINSTTRVLHNPFYVGIIKIEKRGESFQGVHAPLVPKRTFDRVQSILAGRCPTRVIKHDFIFRRLIVCAVCGYGLYGERQKGHVYYRCHGRDCRGTSLREADIKARLNAMFALLAFSDEELRDLGDLGDMDKVNDEVAEEVRISNLKRTLGLCEDRLTRLTDAFLDTSIDKETFEARKVALLGERAEVLDALRDPEEPRTGDDLVKKLELGNMAQLQGETLNPGEERRVVETLVSNLSAEGKELAVRLRFPFDLVAESRKLNSSAHHRGTARNGSKNCNLRKEGGVHRLFTRTQLKKLYRDLKAGEACSAALRHATKPQPVDFLR